MAYHQMIMPTDINGYQNKIEFWTEQLTYSKAGDGRYSVARCEESLAHFTDKQETLLQRRVDAAAESLTESRQRRARQLMDGDFGFTHGHQELVSVVVTMIEDKVVRDFLSYSKGSPCRTKVRRTIGDAKWKAVRNVIQTNHHEL